MKTGTAVAIFAHPDDEAFGPSGTLAKIAEKNDVYIICATSGEQGQNHRKRKSKKSLAEIRRDEIRKAAKVLGVKKVFFLGYKDGTLSNNLYHEVADKLKNRLKKLQPKTIITFEPRGISGHIDHMALAMITTYVFYKLKFIDTLLYYCEHKDNIDEELQNYFIYFPPGYTDEEIDMTVDVSPYWSKKLEAMKQHKSQEKDMIQILKHMQGKPKLEHFITLKK